MKQKIGKALLIFVLAFNAVIIVGAFVVPQFYFLNPAVVGRYSGLAIVTWGAICVSAIVLGFALCKDKESVEESRE